MVKITGRYKELIIGAGGENIAPVPIEDNIKLLCPGKKLHEPQTITTTTAATTNRHDHNPHTHTHTFTHDHACLPFRSYTCRATLTPAVSNVVMIGDHRKFCTALITLKTADTGGGELPGSDDLEGAALTAVPGITTVRL